MSERLIELVTGPYRSGKTGALLETIVEHCSRSDIKSNVVITVPSHRYKRLLEERLLASLNQSSRLGLTGFKILPFYDLCHHVLRQCGHSFRLVPDQLRPAILVRSLARVREVGKLTKLSSIADFAGTHAGMLELIDELERAGLSPSEVVGTLSRQAASDARYMELGRVYESYWQELEELAIYDERKLAYKAREVVNNLDEDALGMGVLAVDGFDRFNKLQVQVLSALSKQAQRTIINFDYVDDAVDSNYSWKSKGFLDLKAALGPALRQRISAGAAVAPARVEISRTLDRLIEMEEVVRNVKQSLADGYKPSDLIVVARTIKPYITAIRAAFDSAGVAYFLDEPIQLASLPLVNYLMRLLSLPVVEFARQEVVRVLASPFFNKQFLELDFEQVEQIDDQSIANLTVKGAGDWLWSPAASRLIERLSFPVAMSITEHVAVIENLIDDLLILPSDEEFADPLLTWEEHQALFEFRRVLGNLVLEETLLAPAYGPVVCSYQSFFKKLEHALEAANFRRPTPQGNVLTICSADLVPNIKYKVMFVAGLNEGEFPRRSEQSGFLSRDEVRKWLSYGIDIENPRHHESFEPSLYNSLIERVVDRMYLSSPMYEMSGEELIPSFFLTRGDEEEARAIKMKPPRREALIHPTSVQELGAAFLWSLGSEAMALREFLPAEGREVLSKLSLPYSTVMARSRAVPGAYNEFNGNLREQVALGLINLPLPDMWSVSRLNDYGKCPFRFWVSHMLGVKPLEEPETGLDARLLGEVYHKILELFYTELQARGLTMHSAAAAVVDQLFAESIERGFVWLEQEANFKRSEFWEYEKKELVFRLQRFCQKEKERAFGKYGDYLPTYFEKGFGFKEADSAPPLVIGEGGEAVRLRGRVDRIDVAPGGRVRVVDYKSSSANISKNEALAGRNMQLPVYAMAVSESILPGTHVSGGVYLSFSKGDSVGSLDFSGSDNPDEDYVAVTREKILDFVRQVKAGNFVVGPSSETVCSNCDHGQICRIGELPSLGENPERGGD
jgi:ATP-dependent helicase/nuclease subunit B